MKYKIWTPADEQMLADLHPHKTNADIAVALGRTEKGVKSKAGKFKLLKSAEFMAALFRARRASTGRTPTVRAAFLKQVSAVVGGPIGASMADMLVVCGGKRGRVKSLVVGSVQAGVLHAAGKGQLMRYFRTAEAARDGVLAIAKHRAAAQRERTRANNAPRAATRALALVERERLKALAQASRPPKPPKVPKVKAVRPPGVKTPKPVKVASPKKAMPEGRREPLRPTRKVVKRFDDRPAFIPDHVRVVRGPCNLDKRYTVRAVSEPHFSALRPGQYSTEASAWAVR